MRIEQSTLPEVLVLTPRRFEDDRGWFTETWNRVTLEKAGLKLPDFVQDNHSHSLKRGTLRGLHYQSPPHAQGKLVRCLRGAILDVAVDIRKGSPQYGQWSAVELSAANLKQVWVPVGFLHGFLTLEDNTEVAYKCTDIYAPECDGAVHWASVGIDWPVDQPLLSPKDAAAVAFEHFESPFA
jgi:dTDP-4-dehydrorhamnose 3,5-epimerase